LAQYNVRAVVQDTNIRTVLRKAEDVFNADFVVEKINPEKSRADRLAEAVALLEDAKGTAEELKEELENWLESLPENLSDSSKANELQEAIDNLEQGASELEEAVDALNSVEFPDMMG
jgi:hypothetical protein